MQNAIFCHTQYTFFPATEILVMPVHQFCFVCSIYKIQDLKQTGKNCGYRCSGFVIDF